MYCEMIDLLSVYKMTKKGEEEIISVEDTVDTGVISLIETANNIESIQSTSYSKPVKIFLIVLCIASSVFVLLGCITDVELIQKVASQSTDETSLLQLETQSISNNLCSNCSFSSGS